MWVKGNLSETSLSTWKAFGFKMEEMSGTFSAWAFVAVSFTGRRKLISLFSPVLLSFRSSSTWMFSIRSHFYFFWLFFYFPFLCLVLFQFWIYSHWISTFKALPSPTGFTWPSDIMRRLAFRGAGCALVKLVNYWSSTSFPFSVLPFLFPPPSLKFVILFIKSPSSCLSNSLVSLS